MFCFHVFVFSSLGYGALITPLPYFLYDPYAQLFNQDKPRHLYLLAQYKLNLQVNNLTKPSLAKQSADWLIDKRNQWSSVIGNTGTELDLFFSGEDIGYKANASFLRIGLESKYSKQGDLIFEPVFKFKLDLPTVKKRLKLVVESSLPEQETLGEMHIDSSLQDEDLSLSATTGAFQYIFSTAKSLKKTMSIGIRLNREPNPFWRMRMKREWRLEHDWSFKALQGFYYFHDDSWGETTQFTFEKPIHSYFFAAKSEARWRHNERLMEYAQILSITKKLSAIRAIKNELGLLAENQPNVVVTDYYFKTTYRRLLYKDWLFYEVTPELLFPREDSFKANSSILMRIEMKFSNL
ncbi:MAG: hypothetical protein ACJAWS_002888 [Oleiphilaceae bacterium]|jgi:hypothetical protein